MGYILPASWCHAYCGTCQDLSYHNYVGHYCNCVKYVGPDSISLQFNIMKKMQYINIVKMCANLPFNPLAATFRGCFGSLGRPEVLMPSSGDPLSLGGSLPMESPSDGEILSKIHNIKSFHSKACYENTMLFPLFCQQNVLLMTFYHISKQCGKTMNTINIHEFLHLCSFWLYIDLGSNSWQTWANSSEPWHPHLDRQQYLPFIQFWWGMCLQGKHKRTMT